MPVFHFETALLPEGWSGPVEIHTDPSGMITRVMERGDAPAADSPAAVTGDDGMRSGDDGVFTGDAAVPGMPNVHGHAFQRGMAGLAEVRGPGDDSFWSWREIMYGFLDRLQPEQVEAVAAQAQCEMLESGFTACGEFHYLHHQPDGTPYEDPGEMAGRIVAAAESTGIALTLLPALYRFGGFGAAPPTPAQQRFASDVETFARIVDSARSHGQRLSTFQAGTAPHSLRAVGLDDLPHAVQLAAGGPVHIHTAEQRSEVEACLAATGARPVQLLLDRAQLDSRWCLIHCTHMDAAETVGLARTRAVAGLCPVTEANLGDGLFPAREYLEAGGRIAVGSDSHVRIDLADELRTLEYGQRLTTMGRNVLADAGESTGRRLFSESLAGGAQALNQPVGAIAPGFRADLVTLDTDHPALVGRQGDELLDAWIFAGDSRVVRDVWVGGRQVVAEGRSLASDRVAERFRDVMIELIPGLRRGRRRGEG